MHDNPDATETEQELAQTDRQQDEEAMRGAEHHDPPSPGEEDDEA